MTTRLLLSFALLVALLPGCGENHSPADAGVGDAMIPADGSPPDAARDAGTDARIPSDDAGPDAQLPMDDAGPDAEVPMEDAGADSEVPMPDAGMDAEVPMTDAGTDAGGCTVPADCDDGDLCNGAEDCVAGACVAGTALVCDDGIACTADSCVPATGCEVGPIDADGDGDPACTDCDDTNPARHGAATEICDGIDNDCDLATDEGASMTHYSDCDGDTWADVVAVTYEACAPPPAADTGCGTATEAWTTRVPDAVAYDCADDDAAVNSGVTTFQTTPMTSVIYYYPYDYNCDMVEEQQYPALGSCVAGAACAATPGWETAVADCGTAGDFITGCTAACAPIVESRTQGCR